MESLNMGYVDSSNKNDWARLYASNNATVLNKGMITKQVMPDVKGMGLKDALFLLEQLHVKVTANGRGKVVKQSVEPGVAISKNQVVQIGLN